MHQRTAYCSACDRPVPVALRTRTDHARDPRQDAAELVCLDYGARCTGALCPMFSFPGDEPARGAGRSTRLGQRPAPGTERHRTGDTASTVRWTRSERAD